MFFITVEWEVELEQEKTSNSKAAFRDKGILTVGVVTMPFETEGGRRHDHAKEGLEELRLHVDTLLVINNQKLLEVHGDLKLRQALVRRMKF